MTVHVRLRRIFAAGALLAAIIGSTCVTVDVARAGSPPGLTADKDTVDPGGSVTFTTNAPGGKLAAFFVGEELWGAGSVATIPNPFSWCDIGGTDEVVTTFRIYESDFSPSTPPPTWADVPVAEVVVTFTGGDYDCGGGGTPSFDFNVDWSNYLRGEVRESALPHTL